MHAESQLFNTLLSELGIAFTPPSGFIPCPTLENSVFNYQYAVRSPSGDLELRYRIDSIPRLEEQRRIANEGIEMLSSMDLKNLHELSFAATVFNMSGGRSDQVKVFRPEQAYAFSGADWVASCHTMLANPNFAPDYDRAFLFCCHQGEVATVYFIALFNNGFDLSGVAAALPGFRFAEQQSERGAAAKSGPTPISASQIQKLFNIIAGPIGMDTPMGKDYLKLLAVNDEYLRSSYRGFAVSDNETNNLYNVVVLPDDGGYIIARRDEHDTHFLRLDADFNLVCAINGENSKQNYSPVSYNVAAKYWAADLAKLGKFADELGSG